jgi:hypothetical protein
MTIFSAKPTNSPFIYYTIPEYQENTDTDGRPIRNQDDEFVYAKKAMDVLGKNIVKNIPTYSYYVRYDSGTVADYRKIYSLSEKNGSHVDRICKSSLKFIKVDPAGFVKYLDFLQLPSDQHYKAAVRECSGM